MQDNWEHQGSKPVAEYTRPMPQEKVFPWGWVLIGLFALIDAVVIARLGGWTQDAFEAWQRSGSAEMEKVGDLDMLAPFTRLVMTILVTAAIILTQAIILWFYSTRRS